MNNTNSFRQLLEKVSAASEVRQVKLPVKTTQLSPVLSEEAVDLHYNVLYKNYIKKALAGEGEFQVAGAKLHSLFFEQLQIPIPVNNPSGEIGQLIIKKFGSYEKFKDNFTTAALEIRGSGWVYLDTNGVIKTIENHKSVSNIAVIIDMWEHSWLIDYKSNKEKYLTNIWKIINWDIVNARLDM